MSQKNLKIRGKFIDKFISKIQALDDGLELFSKVNKKIFKNNNQKGGVGNDIDITTLQLETLQKTKMLGEQQKKLDLLKDSVKTLSSKIAPINDAINQTTSEIRKMTIQIPDISSAAPGIKMFSIDDLKLIENAFIKGIKWAEFKSRYPSTKMILEEQINEAQYKKYVST